MQDLFELKEIVVDIRASNGLWCKHPYEGHPKGCPNVYTGCLNKEQIQNLPETTKWYAVVEEFDLNSHALKMKSEHPLWSDRQCRNLLYWQGSVRSKLRAKTIKYAKELSNRPTIILEIPESHGINVFATMEKVGVVLEKTHPGIVRKIMFIGIQRS